MTNQEAEYMVMSGGIMYHAMLFKAYPGDTAVWRFRKDNSSWTEDGHRYLSLPRIVLRTTNFHEAVEHLITEAIESNELDQAYSWLEVI